MTDSKSPTEVQWQYRPPAQLILHALGIDKADLEQNSVNVSAQALKKLIGAYAASGGMDQNWYAATYPDVHGAVLSGDTPSFQLHFERAGYFEGRSPCALPCDPDYYFERYPDLAKIFSKDRPTELVEHFRTRGYFEGRAGIPKDFNEAERWLHST